MYLNFRVNKPIDFIFDYLTDMQKFVEVHPIIYKIEYVHQNKYKVYETQKVAYIPIRFNYLVTMDNDLEKKEVRFKATVLRFTKIDIHFMLKVDNNATVIYETVIFNLFSQ